MDKLTELLNKGLEAKRAGNYSVALDYYDKAQDFEPTDIRVYGNKMKLHIGLKQYEKAFRNALILFHHNLMNDFLLQNPTAVKTIEQYFSRFYSHNKELSETETFDPDLIIGAISVDVALVELIYRADNLTFLCGHCYVGKTKQDDGFFKSIFNDENFVTHFENLNNSLLGKDSGKDYRLSEHEGYFLCIGFMYAHMNLNFSLNQTNSFIDHYLNKKIRKDIWNYKDFLFETV